MMSDFDVFILAVRALFAGQSPWDVPGFYSPPWALIPFIPLAWMGINWAKALWFVASTVAFWTVARRYLDVPRAIAFMLSYPVLHSILIGNVDWIVMCGLLLPGAWGVLALSVKPHIGLGLIVKRIVDRWPGVVGLLASLGTLGGASLLLFGLWPLRWLDVPAQTCTWNVASWPWLVPFGLYLLVQAIRADDDPLCLAAGLYFAPHLSISSLPLLMLPVARWRWGWTVFLVQWVLVVAFRKYT